MIICFECSQIIKNKLDQLIKHGEYEDYSQAIASAIENLEMLPQRRPANSTGWSKA